MKFLSIFTFVIHSFFLVIANDYFFEVIKPEDLAYSFQIRQARFSAKPSSQAMAVRLVLAEPAKLCNTPNLKVASQPNTVWLIERGECSFVDKARLAKKYGAALVLISDIETGDDSFIDMTGVDKSDNVDIATFYLPGLDGRHLKRRLLYSNEPIWLKIPLNLTHVSLHMIRKPPWDVW